MVIKSPKARADVLASHLDDMWGDVFERAGHPADLADATMRHRVTIMDGYIHRYTRTRNASTVASVVFDSRDKIPRRRRIRLHNSMPTILEHLGLVGPQPEVQSIVALEEVFKDAQLPTAQIIVDLVRNLVAHPIQHATIEKLVELNVLVTQVADDREKRFRELVDEWKSDTLYLSSTTALINHHAYRAIIEMGKEVVPLVLKELEANPDWWFTALEALTDSPPTLEGIEGDLEQSTRVWVEWGKSRSYLL